MPALYRYGQASAHALSAYLQANLGTTVTQVSGEEGTWSPALEVPTTFREAITPSPTEDLGVEVDVDDVDQWEQDQRNNLWRIGCTVRIFIRSSDGQPELSQKRARAYHSALLLALTADHGVSGTEIDAEVGHTTFARVATKAAGGGLYTNVDTRVTVLHQET